jgi:hypothetical protein
VALKMHKNHQILEILKKFSPNHQFEAKITRSDEISPDLATLVERAGEWASGRHISMV